MSEQNFEIRIDGCVIPCNRDKVTQVSEVVAKYINTNPDAEFMNINITHFSEKMDRDFVYNILNKTDDVTLSPGRENFFRYFCTEFKIYEDVKNLVQISSIFSTTNPIQNLNECEDKLFNLSKENFDSTIDFFTNAENDFLSTDKYSIALLILNSCFGRPFEIERYMKFLSGLTLFDQKRNKSMNDCNEQNLFEVFMTCFSIELNEAFLSSAEYQNIDELFFILRYLYDNSKLFKSFLNNKELLADKDFDKKDFLQLYYNGKYNMISFNSLKPIFIENVSITDFDLISATDKYAEDYDTLKEDDFNLYSSYCHIGINGDKLARLIIFDEAEKLEKTLLKAYSYMIENSSKLNEKEKENQDSTPDGSYIASLSSNNNYSVDANQIHDIKSSKFNIPSFDSDYDLLVHDITFDDNDIKEIASRLSSPLTIHKSIYERCSFINNNCTILEYAAFHGSTNCFKMLLKHNLENENINEGEIRNNTDYSNFKIDLNINSNLARFAVAGGSIEIINLIFDLINKSKTESYSNPITFSDTLEIAIKFHHWEIAEQLIEERNNEFKLFPSLLNDCIRYSNFKTLVYLIQNHIKIGNNFLLNCCRYGNFCIAKWALSFATRDVVNCIDEDLHTNILHHAVILNHKPLLSLILQHRKESQQNASYEGLNFGIGINTRTGRLYRCSTALHLAVEHNNYEFTKMILDNGIVNDELPNYQDESDYDDNDFKFDFGPLNIEIRNINSLTPFHIACKNGNFEIVKLFLDNESYNVDINAETAGVLYFFLTSLHLFI